MVGKYKKKTIASIKESITLTLAKSTNSSLTHKHYTAMDSSISQARIMSRSRLEIYI